MSAVIDRLQKIFGEDHYKRETRDLPFLHSRLIGYRSRGFVCYEWHDEDSDEQIITKYLSHLTFEELNALNKNGISILHLAVHYNRGGQYGMEPSCGAVKTGSSRNIVQWLLENQSFYQKGVQGTWNMENYNDWNQPSGTALHLAFCAQVPKNMQFCSENHGGDFGTSFIAGEALDAMMKNKAFMHANINALNKDGQSVLEFAVQMASNRFQRMPNIFFSDGGRFGEHTARGSLIHMDGAIGKYISEYQHYIEKLLQSEYIRTNGMFGLCVLPHGEEKYLIPKQLDHRRKSILGYLSPGMEPLLNLCKSGGKYFQKNENCKSAKSLVEILLNGDSGNLKDALKAQALAICVNDSVRDGGWQFNPKHFCKEVGTVLRKFFVKNSASALYSIERYIRLVRREYKSFSLCDVGDALCHRYAFTSALWDEVLSFTGYRNDKETQLKRLQRIGQVIDEEIVPFFFGGIQACMNRNLKQEVPTDVWGHIFEFAGLGAKLSMNDLDVRMGMGPLYTRQQLMARYEKDDGDEDEGRSEDGSGDSSDESESSSDSDDDGDEDDEANMAQANNDASDSEEDSGNEEEGSTNLNGGDEGGSKKRQKKCED